MKRLVLKSWLWLFFFDWVMHFHHFKQLHAIVRKQQVLPVTRPATISGDICHAVDLACVFYFKRVQCLQRSAVTAVLLRRYGWKAEMVLGAQLLPFLSHAWVEIEGQVVNDKPYMTEIFHVLERC